VSLVSSVDVTISGTFYGSDSQASYNSLAVTAGAALSQVSFFAIPDDISIAIYYPNSATKTSIGSIANGATGYGGFQIIGSPGLYNLLFTVTYKKGPTFYNFTGSLPLQIAGNGDPTEGRRMIEDFQVQLARDAEVEARSGNADFVVYPYTYSASEAITTWQSVTVASRGPALTSVTFIVTPSDPSVAIYYGPNGNNIGNVAANSVAGSSFQMNGPTGRYILAVRLNYRKAGVAYTYTEYIETFISTEETSGSDGKRAVVGKAFLPSVAQNMNSATVAGLVIGGVALIAIVAVVIVVVVVKRQRTTVVA